ncbi:MAG: iron-containing alcohol dehydrogenase [Eggerthellaceae bacterium]|nr:iron-containing alcohol dehydrogenase [Eggerthellaceae bacterium]
MLAAVILHAAQADKAAYRLLANKETVFERQIRVLELLGIKKIICIGVDLDETDRTKKHRKSSTQLLFFNTINKVGKAFPGEGDTILLLQDNVVFSESTIIALLEGTASCQTVISKNGLNTYSGIKARLDMKCITEVGPDLEGVGCFNHTPLYKLPYEVFDSMLQLLMEVIPLDMAMNRLLGDYEVQYVDSSPKPLYASEVNDVFFEIADKQISLCNHLVQPVIDGDDGDGIIANICALLNRNEVRRPFLVRDSNSAAFLIYDYLEHMGYDCTSIILSEAPDYGEIRNSVSQFLGSGCDTVVSLGQGSTINAAKAIKAFSALDPNEDFLSQELKFSHVKHIAIPTVAQFGCESTTWASIIRDNVSHILESDCLLPDYVILDSRLYGILDLSLHDKTIKLRQLRRRTSTSLLKDAPIPNSLLDGANFLGKAVSLCGDNISYTLGRSLAENVGIPIEQGVTLCLPFVYDRMKEKIRNGKLTTEEDAIPLQGLDDLSNMLVEYRRQLQIKGSSNFKALLLDIYTLLGHSHPQAQYDGIANTLAGMIHRVENEFVVFTKEDIAAVYSQVFRIEEPSKQPPKRNIKARVRAAVRNGLERTPRLSNALRTVHKKFWFSCYCFKYKQNVKTVLFESYCGDSYKCNPKALYEQMLKDDKYAGFKFVWSFKQPLEFKHLEKNQNTRIVKKGSYAYLKACAQTTYFISNAGFPEYIKPRKHQSLIYTRHDKPLKRIGCDFSDKYNGVKTRKQMIKIYSKSGKRLTKLLSPSPAFTDIMASTYNLNYQKKKVAMVETGYPRNDFLFTHTQKDVLQTKMRLNIPLHKKVVLYAPTWRSYNRQGSGKRVFDSHLDLAKLHKALGEEYILLLRVHHQELNPIDFTSLYDSIFDVSGISDVNELYIVSDLMISDYSGAIFDYANLRRPIILYMYDLEKYESDGNGLYFPSGELPGVIAHTEKEVISTVLSQAESFTYDEKYKAFNEKFNCWDGSDCSTRTLTQIIDPDMILPQRTRDSKKIIALKRKVKAKALDLFGSHSIFFSKNSKELASYKNQFYGKRCFLIGNGPSLAVSDLDKLKGEVCFGCNFIYKAFDLTDWRPDFLCLSERVLARTSSKELANCGIKLFVSRTVYKLFSTKPEKATYVYDLYQESYYVRGNMMAYYVPSFGTVMTFMIELAMYMGFSEIYLLGVDCTNSHAGAGHFINNYRVGNIAELENQKAKRYFQDSDDYLEKFGEMMRGRSLHAYGCLREYAEKNGYLIFNATRGGALEVFERCNLDEVLNTKTEQLVIEKEAAWNSKKPM